MSSLCSSGLFSDLVETESGTFTGISKLNLPATELEINPDQQPI